MQGSHRTCLATDITHNTLGFATASVKTHHAIADESYWTLRLEIASLFVRAPKGNNVAIDASSGQDPNEGSSRLLRILNSLYR
jgi:hypothetical protein